MKKVAIIGTVGVPAKYGGFETLAENLIDYCSTNNLDIHIIVYCSSKAYEKKPKTYSVAKLKYIPLNPNGLSSIFYDTWSLLSAIKLGCDSVLVLGVSGAICLPIARLMTNIKIITNIDGLEWRRQKWNIFAKLVLRTLEIIAVRFSHEIIVDNEELKTYVSKTYKSSCHVIAYGGDHALRAEKEVEKNDRLPEQFALTVCRIEPENNIHEILDAFAQQIKIPIVIIGNWSNSGYGKNLLNIYSIYPHIYLLDALYDPERLFSIRSRAFIYIHGHSAGGTNPSLVEMMHFGVPIIAYNCAFNRYTTLDNAMYFNTTEDLLDNLNKAQGKYGRFVGDNMKRIARSEYTWQKVGTKYFDILLK